MQWDIAGSGLRQWVLSLPRALRYLLAYNGKLCSLVAGIAMREVMHFQRMQARKMKVVSSAKEAHPGAMLVVQRFGSALNLNLHFHALVLDGVYVLDLFGNPNFVELAKPSLEDLNVIASRIVSKAINAMRKRGIWLDADDGDPVEEEIGILSALAKSSMCGTLAFGNGMMRRIKLKDANFSESSKPERAGKAFGFSLDAEVRVSKRNRLHREQLCRYLLRPPLAKGRLTETMEGSYAFELKTPWPDGTRIVIFSGEDLVGRLAALVPPPRMHQIHFYGVLAPNAKLRSKVVPQHEEDEDSLTRGAVCWEEDRHGKTIRRRWIPWAKLLLHTFSIDVFDCPNCHGRMQRIAWITQPRVIQAILDCVNQNVNPP